MGELSIVHLELMVAVMQFSHVVLPRRTVA
jgi:hypothetical protein